MHSLKTKLLLERKIRRKDYEEMFLRIAAFWATNIDAMVKALQSGFSPIAQRTLLWCKL